MKITICIGSSCHLKGSRQVVEKLQELIAQHDVQERVELSGTCCMENCQKGVCAMLDGRVFSLTPEQTELFFKEEILPKA